MSSKRARTTGPNSVTVRIDPKESFDDEEDSFNESDDDDLGNQGDYECTRSFSGVILVNGQKAGSFSANLIDREAAGPIFHSACDAESGELQEMGCALFSSSGKPRYPALKNDASARHGGFLYIASFNLDAQHREGGATDIGAAAIRALLTSAEIDSRWSVASYIADSGACLTDAEAAEERERMMANVHGRFADAPEEKASRKAKVNERMAKDARQFLRAGFQEMEYKEGGWLYCTKHMMQTPPTSHEAAVSMPLRLTASAGGAGGSTTSSSTGQILTAADEKLLMQLRSTSGSTPIVSMLSQIDSLVAKGADLTRAGALQFCAANGDKDLLQPLLSRGAQINAPDQLGNTALMIAASRIPGQLSMHNRTQDSTFVSTLIALGADKNVVDRDGVSAFGHYLKAIRNSNDFSATFGGLLPKVKVDSTLRSMLTPAGGPTAADKNCADDH